MSSSHSPIQALFFGPKSHYRVTYKLALAATLGAATLSPLAHAAEPAALPEEAASGPGCGHGPSSTCFPSHRFTLAPRVAERPQVGVNFGLVQLALHGFNIAAEFRYDRLWFEYSHGQSLTLNHQPSLTMTQAERDQNLHVFVPYTTGFGVGVTLVDELWLGVEFKTHRYEVSTATDRVSYQTYSIGPVLGFKFFIWRGLHANVYARYWPNVASTLPDGKVSLRGRGGSAVHEAHAFDFFGNVSLGWAFDL